MGEPNPTNERLRLMETFRSVFYTPIYVAVTGGFLYREGLDVAFTTAPPGRLSVEHLKAGTVDVLATGLSRSLLDLDQGHEEAPIHVAQINQRDGFFIISRERIDSWRWTLLEGASLIPVGFTPVPLSALRAVLARQGVDAAKIGLAEGLSAQRAVERFAAGEADFVHLPNPQAEQLIEDGHGHLAVAIGPELGYLCFSSFCVTPDLLKTSPSLIQKFVRGFHHALTWLAGADTAELAGMVESLFPETSRIVLERSIQRYRDQETWPTDPLITERGFTRLSDALIEGGLLKGRHPFDRLVNTEFARKAAS